MTPEEVIDRLVARRLELGWTQEELAQKLGVTNQNVSYWETGRHLPRVGHLEAWAYHLGYDLHLELRERKG